jgi:hypothetical protein
MKRLAVALLLTACTTKPLPRVETVTVKVATPVACIDPANIPTRPAPLSKMPDDANAALAMTLSKLLDWRAFGIEAEGVLRGCSTIK